MWESFGLLPKLAQTAGKQCQQKKFLGGETRMESRRCFMVVEMGRS
jgi:hypothetical protein